MFLIDLFSGVIFYQYGRELDTDSKLSALSCTHEQINWIMIQKLLKHVTPSYTFLKEPKSKFRLFFFRIVTRKSFSNLMYAAIIVNTVQLGLEFKDMSDTLTTVLTIVNIICTLLFILEAIFRLLAHKKRLFLRKWNYVETVVIICSRLY